MYVFNFPAINTTINTVDDRYYQALKIKEEVHEVQDEIENMNIALRNGCIPRYTTDNYIMELMDVIQACETALREFDAKHLAQIRSEVIKKNNYRKYYGD